MIRTSLLIGGFFGFTAVALGAFAAHGLKGYLEESGYAHVFETAVKFQFYHTGALLATAILLQLNFHRTLKYSALCFILGTLLFSGSLYAMAFTQIKLFGPVTPIGGTFLIIGWALFCVGVFKTKKAS